MPAQLENSGIRDNHSRGTVTDFLLSRIRDALRLTVVSAYLTIYDYYKLRQELNRIEHLDFLFGEPAFANRLAPDKTQKKAHTLGPIRIIEGKA